MKLNKPIIFLLILVLIQSVSASSTQSGNTIYIDTDNNLTAVAASINNASALQNVGDGTFLLNANLINNNTANSFYINETDTTWLKINSTNTSGVPTFWYYLTQGKTEINNTKITSWNTTSNTVENLPVISWARSAVYASGASSKMNISNSNLSYLGYNAENMYGVTYVTSSSNQILNNSFLNNYFGIYLQLSSNNNLTSNTGTSNTSIGIYLYSSSNNNNLTSNIGTSNTNVGIYLYASSNNNLTSNIGTSNTSVGIYSYSSSNNNLTSNIGTSNTNVGIRLYSSSNNNLTSNIGTSNTNVGIRLESSSNNNLTSNTGTSNTNIGIYLDFSSNNNLTSNIGTSNTSVGIHLYSSSNNNLTSNVGTSNTSVGIYLYSSSNNNLTSNKFNTNSSTTTVGDVMIRTSFENNTFVNNDQSKPRKTTFYDNVSQFNYSNGSSVFVSTQNIGTASTTLTTNRTLYNWTQSNITFSETWTETKQIQYNVSGLIPSTDYQVWNGTNTVANYNYTTDIAGVLTPFTINFSTSATTIKILQHDFTLPTIDFISPTDTNGTIVARNYTFVNTSVSDTGSPNNLTALINFDNSLVGWWRFNNNTGTVAEDFSGYGNNGTLTNMNTGLDNCTGNCSGWNSSGKFGNALAFDGVNDYVDAGNATNLNITDAITIEVWIKTSEIDDYYGVITSKQASDYPNKGWRIVNRMGYYHVLFGIGTGYLNAELESRFIADEKWHHVGFTIKNKRNVKTYVDGVARTSTLSSDFVASNDNVYVGRGSSIELFNGSIDEVRIYNRALSSEEINASYNAGLYQLYHNFTGLADGTHNYTSYAQDLAGNVNSTIKQYVTIDITPPSTVTLSTPTNNDHTNDDTPTFDWTDATDASPVLYNLLISNQSNFSTTIQDISSISGSTYTLTTPLTDGSYYWKVRANDTVNGIYGDWSANGNFTVVIDTTSPDWILGNYPEADNTTKIVHSITWDAKVYDANLYRISMNVTNSTGHLMFTNYTDDWNASWFNFSHTNDTTGWAIGNYTVELSATDDVGGLNTQTEYYNIEVVPEYIPPNATNITNVTGNFYVNHSWLVGVGNVTNSYNVSQNGTWTNGSTNTYLNKTVGAHGWSNITVWAYNGTEFGKLSIGNVSQNTQVPNNIPVLALIGNKTVNEADLLTFTLTSTDTDSDVMNYTKDSSKGNLNINTGVFTWTPEYWEQGSYNIKFNTTDGYEGYDNETIYITVNDKSPPVSGGGYVWEPTPTPTPTLTNVTNISEVESWKHFFDGIFGNNPPSFNITNITNISATVNIQNEGQFNQEYIITWRLSKDNQVLRQSTISKRVRVNESEQIPITYEMLGDGKYMFDILAEYGNYYQSRASETFVIENGVVTIVEGNYVSDTRIKIPNIQVVILGVIGIGIVMLGMFTLGARRKV